MIARFCGPSTKGRLWPAKIIFGITLVFIVVHNFVTNKKLASKKKGEAGNRV